MGWCVAAQHKARAHPEAFAPLTPQQFAHAYIFNELKSDLLHYLVTLLCNVSETSVFLLS